MLGMMKNTLFSLIARSGTICRRIVGIVYSFNRPINNTNDFKLLFSGAFLALFNFISFLSKEGHVMRYARYVFVLLAVVLLVPVTAFADMNVALNANVTLNGTFFQGGWGAGLTVDKQTVVDGVFFPKDWQWDQGPVWWDSVGQYGTGQNLVIDLNGVFDISKFIVQADDNDAYTLLYRNGAADAWHVIWDIPPYYAWGMQTRPNPYDNTQTFDLGYYIVATELMIQGADPSDHLYSVSEVQAFGHSVPEPATMLLFGAGLTGIWAFRRKIK